ncbi:MAG: HAD family hydrolase [Lachnospiraceae bacterium]|nr:HAD family hydrolase [Lachnospiraceae bacterium]
MDVKACIFDLDGTLTRTQESIARPVNMTLEHFGLPAMPVENYNYYAGDGIDNSLRRALKDAGDPELKYFDEGIVLCRKWYQEDPLYHVAPYEHVVDSIRRLKQMGLKIAVFSNKPHLNAIKVVETIFGKGTFDHIQGQADRIPMKPDPAGVFEILRIFGVNKDQVLYFGDTNTDMMTAHNAGVFAVGVCWGFRPREELEKYGADALLEDPSQIAELAEEKLHTH